ncbi:MAG: diaminopimelate decarboxylase [Anaerocolumna sp.]
MDDNKIASLTRKYLTPLYIFDGDNIEDNYQYMKKLLPEQFDVFYSVKANPSLAICQVLQNNGSGIEVASEGELRLALGAGFNPSDIIFSGPGKVYAELEYAIDQNITAINVESFGELEIIHKIAKLKEKKVNIGIRINPNYESVQRNPVISMMGSGTQFGVDVNQLPSLLSYIRETDYLDIICFHIYAGSQIFDYKVAAEYLLEAINLLSHIIAEHQLEIKILDFGGGFGVSYDGRKENFDFKSFAGEVKKLYDKHLKLFVGKRLVFESGRFLIAGSGYYLTEIQYRKQINGNMFLITDGGMNQNAMATFREKKIRSNFLMHILNNNNQEEVVSVAGPLCTPDDVLGRSVTLNKAERGDILCIHNSGAYGSSFSPQEFLGHPRACEVLVYKGRDYVIREHGKSEDILRGQYNLQM